VTDGRRVVIAEDSVLLLAGLTKLLESAGFEVAATAADAEGLLAAVERERPDVVIADVRMPPTHTDEGIRAALVIRSQWPDIAILVLSNAEIGTALVITDSAVSKHINSIFAKLGLYPGDVGHRRVLAVLRYLGAAPAS
jgi:DNA-binding NarL/FixJ family response regulator